MYEVALWWPFLLEQPKCHIPMSMREGLKNLVSLTNSAA